MYHTLINKDPMPTAVAAKTDGLDEEVKIPKKYSTVEDSKTQPRRRLVAVFQPS